MAEVPLYNPGAVTAPAPLPGPTMSGTSPEEFGSVGARITQQAGAAAENLFHEQRMLQNQVRVNDALNQARQTALDLAYDPKEGYLSQTGRSALERDSGMALTEEYSSKLGGAVDSIAADLTPEQQRVFRMQSSDLMTGFYGDVQKHMLTQSRQYALSVQDSAVKLATDQVGMHWDDPERIDAAVKQAQAAVYASGKLTGGDVQAALFEAGSAIHTKVVRSALTNQDPLYAMKYLNAHSQQMTTDDILSVQHQVNEAGKVTLSEGAVNAVRDDMRPAFDPTPMDRLSTLIGLVANRESGNRDLNPDGSPITSSAGAKYAMQVMPATAADPGHGIKPAANDSPAEYNRVGRELLGALIQKYGNVPQALAAYNGGEGNVDKAIAETKSVGEPQLWINSAHIANETRAYVAAIAPKFVSGAGTAPMPTKEEFIDAAVAKLGPKAAPDVVTYTRTLAEQRYGMVVSGRAQRADEAVRAVQQGLFANGGDMAALQRDQPGLFVDLMSKAPDRYDDVLRYAKTLAVGERVDNMEAYGAAVSHPEELAAMTDAQADQFLRSNFKDGTVKELWKLRQDTINGTGDSAPGAINSKALNDALDSRLESMGLDWKTAKAAKDDKASYGAVQRYLRDGIFEAQRQANKKFTAEEVSAFVDKQFANQQVIEHWYGDRQKPLLTLTYSDVPSNVRAAIDARMPGAPETDKLRAYWAWKQKGGAGGR